MSENELRVLIVDYAEDARIVREMLESVAGPKFSAELAENLVAALSALTRSSFDVMLVELALTDSQGLSTFETLQRHARGLPIVIHTGTANEVQALNAVERGAQDYLIKGRPTPQALLRVLQYAVARHNRAGDFKHGEPTEARALGFLAAKGGVGATTLAAHFAVELARQTSSKVLLLDLDRSGRSAACLFKTDSRYSVSDAATNLHRLDPAFWARIVVPTSHRVDLLQSPGAVGATEELSGERVRHVLRFAKTLYGYIVVDLGPASPVSLRLLEEIPEIYLVATGGMLEMYETSRALRRVTGLGFRESQVHLLINRVTGPSFVTRGAIEKALGHSSSWTISDCTRELEDIYSAGNFIDPSGSLRRQCESLVARQCGHPDKATERHPGVVAALAENFKRILSGPRSVPSEEAPSATSR